MKLVRISIEKLFGQFDYNIKLNHEEGITILTGPNGYGKTTILNIIWSLFNQNFEYTRNIPFGEISLVFDSGLTIRKTKENIENISADEKTVLESVKVYLIKDQRISYAAVAKRDGTIKRDGTVKRDGAAVLVKTISLYSTKLVTSIFKKKTEEQQLADELASSQHNRIRALSNPLAESEFRKRFNALRERYRQLQNMGIYTVSLEDTDYNDNKGYLSIFLQDWEERTAVYADLLLKVNVFLSILNGKELINKVAGVTAKDGFLFLTSDGNPLSLSALSSGEQHETILLYELLFNAPPDSLVLIDEPEASMHVVWQIEFFQDIERIARLSGLSFIIATHAPDLINDKMDLCVDLFENARRKEQT
jgi:predicted ATP-binding protein involved in virulence